MPRAKSLARGRPDRTRRARMGSRTTVGTSTSWSSHHPATYALRACHGALLVGSKPALASISHVAAGGGRWLLMAVRGHLGGTPVMRRPGPAGPWSWAPPLSPVGLTAAGPFAGGKVVKGGFACALTRHFHLFVVLRTQPPLMPYRRRNHNPTAVWWGSLHLRHSRRRPGGHHHAGLRVFRENGVWGVLRRVREGRRAVRVRDDNTGGAAPWDRGLGREPQQESLARGVKSVPHGMLPVVLGRAVCQPEAESRQFDPVPDHQFWTSF